jgi:hypothetical protein
MAWCNMRASVDSVMDALISLSWYSCFRKPWPLTESMILAQMEARSADDTDAVVKARTEVLLNALHQHFFDGLAVLEVRCLSIFIFPVLRFSHSSSTSCTSA